MLGHGSSWDMATEGTDENVTESGFSIVGVMGVSCIDSLSCSMYCVISTARDGPQRE